MQNVPNRYFNGDALWGDDFAQDEIDAWFSDERDAYAQLVSEHKAPYQYAYHALNEKCGFSNISKDRPMRALGMGSAFGDEFFPIEPYLKDIDIVDASTHFENRVTEKSWAPRTWHRPTSRGDLPFGIETFDIVTCFGVLHHIPNVSFVVGEMFRVLRRSGWALIREPIVSMGDWRVPRPGLTKRERGIPRSILLSIVSDAGFVIEVVKPCMFGPLARVANALRLPAANFNSHAYTGIDLALSSLFSFNSIYHRTNPLYKFGPSAIFLVLRKP